ncbi:hypothetical protein D3C77_461470 [compost metagenome]
MRDDAHRRIGVGGVPAGVCDVVVELVLDVPAEHHIAEAAAVLQGGEELAAVDVLAAHHPVDIEHAHLHMGEAALLDDAPGVLDGLFIPWIEHEPPVNLSLWLTSRDHTRPADGVVLGDAGPGEAVRFAGAAQAWQKGNGTARRGWRRSGTGRVDPSPGSRHWPCGRNSLSPWACASLLAGGYRLSLVQV